jgi:archaemetzincin
MGKIFVSPVGGVNDEMMNMMARHIGGMFGFEVEMYTSFPEPDYALDARRGQYSSALILQNLASVCPPEAVRFLAITEADLFIPMVTFVYGQAQLSGRTALVSLARLSQEFYGLQTNKELKTRRARKETAHELGHTFGLVHCRDRACLMSLSTEILQIDMKSEDFCAGCWAVLEETLTRLRKEIRKNKVVELRR